MYWVLSIISYDCSVYKYTNGNFTHKGNGGKQYDDGVRPISSYVPRSLQTKEPHAVVVVQNGLRSFTRLVLIFYKNTLTDDKTKRVLYLFYVGLFIPCHISSEKKKRYNFHCKNESEKEFRASVDWFQYGIRFNSGKRTVTKFIRKTMTLKS